MIEKLTGIGRIFFALCMVAFGVQNIVFQGFVKGLELTPEWVPWHAFWGYLMGAVLVVCGVSLAFSWRTRLAASLVGLLYFASVVFLRLPRLGLTYDVGERTELLEPLAIGCVAIVLAGVQRGETTGWRAWDSIVERATAPARVVFGLSMVIFGIDHFQVLQFIASLIPAWIPGPLFWAAFTGAAFVAAGICIVTRWRMRLASALLGLMFFLWVVVLHAPRVAASLHNGNEWNSAFVALAMCGANWIFAGLPERKE